MKFIRTSQSEEAPSRLSLMISAYLDLLCQERSGSRNGLIRVSSNLEAMRRMVLAHLREAQSEGPVSTKKDDYHSQYDRETRDKLSAMQSAFNKPGWGKDLIQNPNSADYKEYRTTIYRFLVSEQTQKMVLERASNKKKLISAMPKEVVDQVYFDTVDDFMASTLDGEQITGWEKAVSTYDPTKTETSKVPFADAQKGEKRKKFDFNRTTKFTTYLVNGLRNKFDTNLEKAAPDYARKFTKENPLTGKTETRYESLEENLGEDFGPLETQGSESAEMAALRKLFPGDFAESDADDGSQHVTPGDVWDRARGARTIRTVEDLFNAYNMAIRDVPLEGQATKVRQLVEQEVRSRGAGLSEKMRAAANKLGELQQQMASLEESKEGMTPLEAQEADARLFILRQTIKDKQEDIKDLNARQSQFAKVKAAAEENIAAMDAAQEVYEKFPSDAHGRQLEEIQAKTVRGIAEIANPTIFPNKTQSADRRWTRKGKDADGTAPATKIDLANQDLKTEREKLKHSELLPHIFSVLNAGGKPGFKQPVMKDTLKEMIGGVDAEHMDALSRDDKEAIAALPVQALFKRLLYEASLHKEATKAVEGYDAAPRGKQTVDAMKALLKDPNTVYNARREELQPLVDRIAAVPNAETTTFETLDEDMRGMLRAAAYEQARAELFADTPWKDLSDEQLNGIAQKAWQRLFAGSRRLMYGTGPTNLMNRVRNINPQSQEQAIPELLRELNNIRNWHAQPAKKASAKSIFVPGDLTVKEHRTRVTTPALQAAEAEGTGIPDSTGAAPQADVAPEATGAPSTQQEGENPEKFAAAVNALLRRATILERMGRYAEADRVDQRLAALASHAR